MIEYEEGSLFHDSVDEVASSACWGSLRLDLLALALLNHPGGTGTLPTPGTLSMVFRLSKVV